MFQESEILTLMLGLIGLLILFHIFKGFDFPASRQFKIGYLFMVGGFVSTIAEGYLFYFFFNLLEHFCYSISAWFFAWGAYIFQQQLAARPPAERK